MAYLSIYISGLRFIDTRGFRVPLVPTTTLGLLNAEWLKEYLQWERLLRSVRTRMDSQSPTDRPLAIMYARLVRFESREREVEDWRCPVEVFKTHAFMDS